MKKQIPWHLIIAQLEQNITPGEKQQLTEWLSNDQHRQAYDEISALWKKTQERAKNYAPQPALYWEQLAQKLELPSTRKKHKAHLSIKSLYKIAACAAILLFSALSYYLGFDWYTPKEMPEQCYTNLSGKSQITLPDGTLVWLHADTKLSYKTDFQKKSRTVTLEGEAYFEVSKDKDKRFIVHAGELDIAVYGTKFNVFSRTDSNNIDINLLEGSVAVKAATGKKELFLQPGEAAVYNKQSRKISIAKDEVNMNAAWAMPKVYFHNRSLEQICEVLSKRFDVEIELAPELKEKYVYTFTLHDENISEILELITNIHPIKYHFINNRSIYISQ